MSVSFVYPPCSCSGVLTASGRVVSLAQAHRCSYFLPKKTLEPGLWFHRVFKPSFPGRSTEASPLLSSPRVLTAVLETGSGRRLQSWSLEKWPRSKLQAGCCFVCLSLASPASPRMHGHVLILLRGCDRGWPGGCMFSPRREPSLHVPRQHP